MTLQAVWAARAANGALNTIIGATQILKNDKDRLESFSSDNSLVGLTASSRVEPLCIISQDLVHVEYTPDVLQALQSIFAGYYLQAVAMTTQINGVSVTKLLDKLNPDRRGDALSAGLSIIGTTGGKDWRLNSLAYEHRLPTTKNVRAMAFENEVLDRDVGGGTGNPRDDYWAGKNNREQDLHELQLARDKAKDAKDNKVVDQTTVPGAILGDPAIKSIREITDLSVGKMFNITIGGGKDKDGKEIRGAMVPISIRLMVNAMPEAGIVSLLASGTMDNSMKERYHAWRAGRIEFIRDLILCQDMIDEHRKAMMADTGGVHSEIVRRVNNAKLAGLASRDPSLNVASNIYVLSEVTAEAIEKKLGGKLNNAHTRAKIFDSGYAMIIVVIDRQWERVSFYHRGISTYTTVGLRDIKIANKGSGPDVGDILKAYQLGNSPQL